MEMASTEHFFSLSPYPPTHRTIPFASGIPDTGGQALICSSEIARVELFYPFTKVKREKRGSGGETPLSLIVGA